MEKIKKNEGNKMVNLKMDLSKKSILKKKGDGGTLKSIIHGVYDPIELVSHRSKNNKSSGFLPNHSNSKTVFDWKK